MGPRSGATPLNFDSLGLAPDLLRAVREQGYDTPTPVQREAIPAVLDGEDLLAAAQTGTGKTAGFALPLLQRLMESPQKRSRFVRALVLVPTRELALQVDESVRIYGAHLPIRSVTIFGGVGMGPQINALRAGRDVVVATPGRLLDHITRKTIDLGRVEILVLDEADRMLDMGFIRDIKRIIAQLPAKRQNLLFSATFSNQIRALADGFLNSPRQIDVAPRNSAAETVRQRVNAVERNLKTDRLVSLIHDGHWEQVLVFTRTKHGADRLARKLERAQVTAAAIHGNKSQNARTRALASFKQGAVRVLVATDIAARGLDIDGLPHVVNFELPHVPEDYVHRIGRTGRAGASGEALSLVSAEEEPLLAAIEKLLGRRLPRGEHDAAALRQDSAPNAAHREQQSKNRVRSSGDSGISRAPDGDGAFSAGQVPIGRTGNTRSRGRDLPGNIRGRQRRPGGKGPSTREMDVAIGTVKWFNHTKGFGFIAPQDRSQDIFVHVSALEGGGIDALAEGQKIAYAVGTGRDGRAAAENVRLVE